MSRGPAAWTHGMGLLWCDLLNTKFLGNGWAWGPSQTETDRSDRSRDRGRLTGQAERDAPSARESCATGLLVANITMEYMNVPLVVLARSKLDLALNCRATIAAHAITAYAYECAPCVVSYMHASSANIHTYVI